VMIVVLSPWGRQSLLWGTSLVIRRLAQSCHHRRFLNYLTLFALLFRPQLPIVGSEANHS
jgi:hypothetical protein